MGRFGCQACLHVIHCGFHAAMHLINQVWRLGYFDHLHLMPSTGTIIIREINMLSAFGCKKRRIIFLICPYAYSLPNGVCTSFVQIGYISHLGSFFFSFLFLGQRLVRKIHCRRNGTEVHDWSILRIFMCLSPLLQLNTSAQDPRFRSNETIRDFALFQSAGVFLQDVL